VTLGLLQQAKQLNIPALWLQPGAEDDAVKSYIYANGLEDKVLYGGPCILVEGDGIRQKSLL
jgi:predicted CoA-binding protein